MNQQIKESQSCLQNIPGYTGSVKHHLVDLPPDQEDDCHEVEDDEGGDEDGSL